MLDTLKLCLVTKPNYNALDQYFNFLHQAINGGVTSIQLRDKTNALATIQTTALALIAFLKPLNIPLIINDHVQLAKEIDAQGVHLGQSDLSPIKARQILGPEKIIGWSIENEEQLEQANQLDCLDYIGVGAIFPSQTKTDCKRIWGLDALQKAVQQSRHPVVAIGGISQNTIRDVMLCGVAGVAVVGAIQDQVQPKQAAAKLIQKMNAGDQYA